MKNYREVILNLKKTITKGGSRTSIAALKRKLILLEKKSEEDFT
jgi:hypothetical protein